jgi:NAD-dependent SIR2 family protein deacetylase
LKSPVDSDFFDICNVILSKNNNLAPAFSSLTEHLKTLFGLELPSEKEKQGFSMEGVTTILNLESREKGREYIDALVNLICIVFDIVLSGPVSPIHQELAIRFQQNDSIISYNYDLAVDNALMTEKALEEGIYNLNFDQKFEVDWRQCENIQSDITLLKLHGSMNWLKCTRCGALLFYGNRKAVAELSYQTMKIRPFTTDLSCPSCLTRELKPLLISPLLEKEIYEEEFKYPWFLAEKAIVSAERIVVIGYSLPPTDFYSEFMIRKALSKRFRGKPILDVVDKNIEEISQRFEKLFGTTVRGKYKNLRDYLDRCRD